MNVSKVIRLDSIQNIRDLGGIVNKDGYVIKDNLLIRSSELSHLSRRDMKKLYKQIGVQTVFDFRSEYEAHRAKDKLDKDTKYFLNEIATDDAFGVRRDEDTRRQLQELMARIRSGNNDMEASREYMCFFYRNIAYSGFSVAQYGRFLYYIMTHDVPVLWHCSLGKDRCGIGTALVLEALGVDRESIIEDYLYTNEIYDLDPDVDNPFEVAHRSYIETYFEEAEKTHGSMTNLFEKMWISKEIIDKFKERVLQQNI